jgi:hypothetical protein
MGGNEEQPIGSTRVAAIKRQNPDEVTTASCLEHQEMNLMIECLEVTVVADHTFA